MEASVGARPATRGYFACVRRTVSNVSAAAAVHVRGEARVDVALAHSRVERREDAAAQAADLVDAGRGHRVLVHVARREMVAGHSEVLWGKGL